MRIGEASRRPAVGGGERQVEDPDPRADPRGPAEVAEVLDEAVRDVDRRPDEAGQGEAGGDPRRGPPLAARQGRGGAAGEAEGGVADGAGDGDEVARARAGAEHRPPLRNRADHRHGEGEGAGAGDVPAHDRGREGAGAGAEPAREPPDRRHRGARREPERHQGAQSGRAPMAARSERFTASAFQPTSAGVDRRSKWTPSTTASTVTTRSSPGAGRSTAASSPGPTTTPSAAERQRRG